MVVRCQTAPKLYSLCYTLVNKAAFTLQVFMTNSDFVTMSIFLDDVFVSFKSNTYPICAFYTALGDTN